MDGIELLLAPLVGAIVGAAAAGFITLSLAAARARDATMRDDPRLVAEEEELLAEVVRTDVPHTDRCP